VGKKVDLKVGNRVAVPVPMVAVPLSTGKLEGKPVNLNVGATEGNRVPMEVAKRVGRPVPVPVDVRSPVSVRVAMYVPVALVPVCI